jgi:hypothetical protein
MLVYVLIEESSKKIIKTLYVEHYRNLHQQIRDSIGCYLKYSGYRLPIILKKGYELKNRPLSETEKILYSK